MARFLRNCISLELICGLLLGIVATGCEHKVQTPQERLQLQYDTHPEFKQPHPVAKFAGQVSIDGKRPQKNCKLFVILHDPKHLDEAAKSPRPLHYAVCEIDGTFSFTTYDRGDGVPPGNYVVTFVELHEPPGTARGSLFRAARIRGGPRQYDQPDELNNLYNDPDKNMKQGPFVLDVNLPGKEDYRFALAVTGKKPILKPGPNAVTGRPFLQ